MTRSSIPSSHLYASIPVSSIDRNIVRTTTFSKCIYKALWHLQTLGHRVDRLSSGLKTLCVYILSFSLPFRCPSSTQSSSIAQAIITLTFSFSSPAFDSWMMAQLCIFLIDEGNLSSLVLLSLQNLHSFLNSIRVPEMPCHLSSSFHAALFSSTSSARITATIIMEVTKSIIHLQRSMSRCRSCLSFFWY